MSVLKKGEVAPSRVKGVVRYLQQAKGKRERRNTLEALLSPTTLINKGGNEQASRNMIHITVSECIKMGLLIENEEISEVSLNPELDLDESSLPYTLAQLLLNTPDHSENYDLARVLAWYLAQDFFSAPRNWQEFQQRLREQIGADLLELNDVRFGQFRDWSRYLGFSWSNSLAGNQILVPDPTIYLKSNLNRIFDGITNQQVLLGDFIKLLGKDCPIFETGSFREAVDDQLRNRDSNYLSNTTSMALLRLEDEGLIKLEKLSDITVWILQDESTRRISHITYLSESSRGENA
ncbi:hypothetical protein IQ273_18630 [Nodosilinea sp. LEGE 07298]|uniref:protein DpdG n=1 Tax=Nodosilinea sp. LEGE 07298 TaxID=2777970 RepID=UPI00187FFF67|nr:protein DpdG [Nodosilinea sp. LEGE 07298]MBE9111424.1 hypothetical protein [Nodosilinea sp. LEGE 07298]